MKFSSLINDARSIKATVAFKREAEINEVIVKVSSAAQTKIGKLHLL